MDLPPMNALPFYQRAFSAGVTFTVNHGIRGIRGDTVVIYNIFTQEEREVRGIDVVIVATGNTANSGLLKALEGRTAELFAAGDCVAPRKALEAIHEGHLVGRAI